ncbi:MAG: hypothetical protein LOD84_04685 [Limnochordales bacterium]
MPGRNPRRPRTLVKIDNPDDAEVLPESVMGDDETLVVLDNPDDAEAQQAGPQGAPAGPGGRAPAGGNTEGSRD